MAAYNYVNVRFRLDEGTHRSISHYMHVQVRGEPTETNVKFEIERKCPFYKDGKHTVTIENIDKD